MRRFTKLVLLTGFLLGAFVALKGFVLAIPSGTWQATGNLSAARPGASAALLQNGSVLITGGDPGSGPVASADLFNSDGSVSPLAAPMNNPRSNHISATLQDGRVLVAGGTVAGGGATNSAEIFDPVSGTWSSIAGGMVEARSGAAAALLQDGRVLIAGGESSGVASATLEIFDPVAGTFSAAGVMSSPRTKHAMAVLADGRVIIIGGSNGTAPVASTDILNPVAGSVAAGPSLATPRSGHSATTLLDGRILVVGGNNILTNPDGSTTTVDLSSAEIFDPAAGTFTTSASALATARAGHLAFLLPHNNNVLIVGGTSNGISISSAELFTPWQGTFSATGSLSTARSNAAGSPMQQDGLLLVAGGKDAATPPNALASTEVYGFATVKTDKADYAPGTTVTITGSGWRPGETVTLSLQEVPFNDTHGPYTAVADSAGNILNTDFVPNAADVGIRFYLTAVGSISGSQAQTTFTDASPVKLQGVTVTGTQTPNPVAAGSSATYGSSASNSVQVSFSGTTPSCGVTLSVASGLPSGATATFNPTIVTSTNGSPQTSLLTINTSNTTPAGTSTLTVTATESSVCSGGSKTTTATLVVQNSTSLSVNSVTAVYGQTVNLSATLTSGSPAVGESGQTVTFTLNGNGAGSGTTNGSGVATSSASLGTIAPGTYTTGVNANFAGNGPILASSAANSLTVSQANTTTALTSSASSSAFGQSVTFTATVSAFAPGSGTRTGTVQFVIDGSNSGSPVALSGGTATSAPISSLPLGSHTVTATYSGDTNFTTSTSSTLTQTVGQASTSIGVTSSVGTSVFGQSVTLTAAISVTAPGSGAGTAPTGTVQFQDNGTNVGSPQPVSTGGGVTTATLTTTALTVGAHNRITAVYSGDGNFSGNTSGNFTQTVNRANTTTLITTDLSTATVVGQPYAVAFTVTVNSPGSGTPSGNVTVSDGSQTCTGTVAAGTCNLTSTTAGAKTITASYPSDTNFNSSTSLGVSHTVNQASTSTALTSSPNASVFGQSVAFTATVSPQFSVAPTGTVTFKDGTTTICNTVALNGSTQATCNFSTLSLNGHSITAVYNGDTNFNTSTSAILTQTVNQASTTTALTSSANPSVFGQSVTFTATVSAFAPGSGTRTGTVQFAIDGSSFGSPVNLSGGTATSTAITSLSVSGHTVTAAYSGDTNFTGSSTTLPNFTQKAHQTQPLAPPPRSQRVTMT